MLQPTNFVKVLFVHQNFPAQFANVAAMFASRPDHEVVAIGSATARSLPNVRLVQYGFSVEGILAVHPFARSFDAEVRRAEQIIYVGSELLASGFKPDIVVVHCGWGESLPLRALFPEAKIVTYFELFYRDRGFDVDFDPEWPRISVDGTVGLKIRNASTLLALADTDVAISPTQWQRSSFPAQFRHLIEVCHEGIDTERVCPDPRARLTLSEGVTFQAGDEIITYVSRNLEPLRGYHVFMRSLARTLRARPRAQVVIVGGDRVSYGLGAPAGTTWKEHFLDQNRDDLDLSRVHFLGRVDYETYLRVLQVSAVHVYLTYPFVLSWSMLEAMAAGCLVVASATGPVTEVIDRSNGLLVDFFDHSALSNQVCAVLATRDKYQPLRAAARQFIVEHYAKDACVADFVALIERRTSGIN